MLARGVAGGRVGDVNDRWGPVRKLALETREGASPRCRREGLDLVKAALAAKGIEILRLAPDDPMLRGARAVYDVDYVGYDHTAEDPQIAFYLAHELGHHVLHGTGGTCGDDDIDELAVPSRLPYGAASVDVYNARQQRELEANVFAATFLLPAEDLRERFLAGDAPDTLAEHYGVSQTVVLNALANTLLLPPSTPAAPAPELKPLDPSQRAAAEVPRGPVLVSAGPGTGKTRTLVGRVLYLIERGVPPRRILSVTFSNRAADEMRARLILAAPEHAHQLNISTIHAFCLELLRRYHKAAGLPPDIAIADEIQAAVLLERNLPTLGLDRYLDLRDPALYLKDIVRAISRAKDELATPDRYAQLAEAARAVAGDDPEMQEKAAKWAEVARVYSVYERLLALHGLIDFGGLVMRCVELLRTRPGVLAEVRAEYREILVDEYQDMNRASAALLQLLAGNGAGLWVVGDVRQAIYGFRGAASANITEFERDFPGGEVIGLDSNYRSDPVLVGLFRAAGAGMNLDGAPPATWEAIVPGEPPPRVWVASAEDEVAEGGGIAQEILRRNRSGRAFKDQAVLVRTHRQADVIVASLEEAGVPTLYLGDLFARPEIRSLLSLISLVAEGDGGGLLGVATLPEHSMARRDVIRLIQFGRERQVAFPGALRLAAEAGVGPDTVRACHELRTVLQSIRWQVSPWQFLVRYLFGHGGLVRRLLRDGSAQASQQLMAIGQLLAVARAFEDRSLEENLEPSQALGSFLKYVRHLVAKGEDGVRTPVGGDSLDAVRVLTVHAAKGVEFPVVYVTNLADKRFPFRELVDAAPPPPGLSQRLGGDRLEEETKLFFVAISRAKSELVLSYATQYGKTDFDASPLLGLVEPFLAVEPPARLEWPAAEAVPRPAGLAQPCNERVIGVREVELYQRCPRRYEYRYAIGLQGHDGPKGYESFKGCVYRIVERLRAAHVAGGLPDLNEALAMLGEEWDRDGPYGHAYEQTYRETANMIVTTLWTKLREASAVITWADHLDVDLEQGTVRVPVDASQINSDGSVWIARMLMGREQDGDRKAPRLALLRSGAGVLVGGRQKVTIELEYLTTGETKVVRDGGHWEDKRVAKVSAAIGGMRAGSYPPEPENARDCSTCPYWMVCPA